MKDCFDGFLPGIANKTARINHDCIGFEGTSKGYVKA
jgi:hypothetical protein